MKYNYLFFLFLFLFSYQAEARRLTHADRVQAKIQRSVEGMIVAQDLALSSLEHHHAVICSFNSHVENIRTTRNLQCNEEINDLYRRTMNPSLFSLFSSESPYQNCMENMSLSDEQYQQALTHFETMSDDQTNFTSHSFLCSLRQYEHMGPSTYLTVAGMMEASHVYHHKRIEGLAQQSLYGLNEINMILGQDVGIANDIRCTDEVSESVQNNCERLKECVNEGSRGRIMPYADMTFKTIESIMALEEANEQLMIQRSRLVTGNYEMDPQEWGRQYRELETIMEDNENTIEELKANVPWLEGSSFRSKRNEFEDAIREINESDSALARARSQSLMRDIGITLTEQLTEDRAELIRRYDKALRANRCLKRNQDCDDYQEIIESAPLPNLAGVDDDEQVAPESSVVANQLFERHQCLEEKSGKIQMVNGLAIDAVSIAAGFALGGIGGVTRAAIVAGRILQRGQRARALGAAGLLAAEGAAIGHLGGETLDSCQRASSYLNNTGAAVTEQSCRDQSNMHVIEDYSSCIADSTMLALNVVGTIVPDFLTKSRYGRATAAARARDEATQLVDDILDGRSLGSLDKQSLHRTLMELGIKEDEVRKYNRLLNSLVENGVSQDVADTTLRYFNTLTRRQQDRFVANADIIMRNEAPPAGTSDSVLALRRRLQRTVDRFDNFETRARQREYDRQIARGATEEEAREVSADVARSSRITRERNALGCSARRVTPQHERGGRLFTRFAVGFGMGSTAFGYAAANSDEPMDARFFGNLSYELVMSYVMSYIGAKLASNPTFSVGRLYAESNIRSGAIGVFDAAVFAKVYGISEEEAQERIERLRNSPEQLEDLRQLEQHLDSNNIYNRMEDFVWDQFQAMRTNPETADLYQQEEVEIGNQIFDGPITDERLQDPEYRRAIRTAMMREIYSSVSDGNMDLGNIGADKWAYDRAYNLSVGVPKAMVFSYLSYRMLCRGADRPIASLSKVFGLQFINQYLLGGYLYYAGRDEVIGR